jgi:hypothetical protein
MAWVRSRDGHEIPTSALFGVSASGICVSLMTRLTAGWTSFSTPTALSTSCIESTLHEATL